MQAPIGASLVALAAAVACGAATGTGPRTGLYGKVTKGPLTPVCTVGTPCDGPARDTTLVFSRNGAVVARARTRDDGTYRVAVQPGRYAVRAVPRTMRPPEPGTASVPRTGFRRVDFFLDTGIR
jgi:hypothetical protein